MLLGYFFILFFSLMCLLFSSELCGLDLLSHGLLVYLKPEFLKEMLNTNLSVQL